MAIFFSFLRFGKNNRKICVDGKAKAQDGLSRNLKPLFSRVVFLSKRKRNKKQSGFMP
jgi:hypothetical protein